MDAKVSRSRHPILAYKFCHCAVVCSSLTQFKYPTSDGSSKVEMVEEKEEDNTAEVASVVSSLHKTWRLSVVCIDALYHTLLVINAILALFQFLS